MPFSIRSCRWFRGCQLRRCQLRGSLQWWLRGAERWLWGSERWLWGGDQPKWLPWKEDEEEREGRGSRDTLLKKRSPKCLMDGFTLPCLIARGCLSVCKMLLSIRKESVSFSSLETEFDEQCPTLAGITV